MVEESFHKLRAYCEAENYKGWDPYDGLNSKVFQSLPILKYSALCRLIMIQTFKRCPINLRKLFLVPKEHNAKGVGLFLQGYCNLYRNLSPNPPSKEGSMESREEILGRIRYLADLLIEMRSDKILHNHYHGACWGYNFDWQARRLFLFPKYTPTVVATSFCATALFEAYEILKSNINGLSLKAIDIEKYKEVALSSAEFVLQDLHRYYPDSNDKSKFLFSYSPLQGNDTVYNASLLGSRLLSYCYKYSGKEEYKEVARQSVLACCEGQEKDGSWVYGLLPVQSWKDSFHTGYNLDGLIAYEEFTGDTSFHENIERGFKYYTENFFDKDGVPKYYHNKKYPIDIHCPGQLFVTLARLHKYAEYRDLANKVMDWTICNMQDRKGYFYYQLKKGISSKISYMRWSNAFMFCAMTYFLSENNC
ncbi:MAG: glycoside hydrolase family 88 protein [Prevotellaceae bacterium]|nr:glycoside hydrolase family 88 protein [Candidatus Faecinaster equi]